MHELSLVRSVVDIVLNQAEASQAARVAAVHLTVGQGRDIPKDYLVGLFEFLTRDTVAAGARLVVNTPPLEVGCNACGTCFAIDPCDSKTLVCPHCGTARDYRLMSGMEFTIDRIEVARQPLAQSA